ncbi:MAG: hypothetical protein KGL39_19585 [Patescibacteria group bacterium]|nr:hypothetical protein [Patescibacteria group bacterium]
MSHTPQEEKLLREKFAETERNFSRMAYRHVIRKVAAEIIGNTAQPETGNGLVLETTVV